MKRIYAISLLTAFAFCAAHAQTFSENLSSALSAAAQQTVLDNSAYSDQVKAALELAKKLPTTFSAFQKEKMTDGQLQELLKSIKEADISKCPEDFRASYSQLAAAAEKFQASAAKLPKDKNALISGALGRLASSEGSSSLSELTEAAKKDYDGMNSARSALYKLGVKYSK